jgi:hypothetical protein
MNKEMAVKGIALGTSSSATSISLQTSVEPPLHDQHLTTENTADKLRSALATGSVDEYQEALILEQYRDALLAQAQELQSIISDDLLTSSREIAPRVYGWPETRSIPGISKQMRSAKTLLDTSNLESLWQKIR